MRRFMTIMRSEKAAVVLYKSGCFFSGPEQQFIDAFQECSNNYNYFRVIQFQAKILIPFFLPSSSHSLSKS